VQLNWILIFVEKEIIEGIVCPLIWILIFVLQKSFFKKRMREGIVVPPNSILLFLIYIYIFFLKKKS